MSYLPSEEPRLTCSTFTCTLNLRYKLYNTTAALRWELSMVFLTACMDVSRIRMAARGNKTENATPLLWSCGLSVSTVVAYTFFFKLQTFV